MACLAYQGRDCRRNLDGEFALIHDILRPTPGFATLKDAEKTEWVRFELSQTDRPLRLLVLDNAEDEETVAAWISEDWQLPHINHISLHGLVDGHRNLPSVGAGARAGEGIADAPLRTSGCRRRG